ncbi:MAG: hypothetical protein ACE5KM_21440 [Planctomycetaceae bacterium]
MTTNRDYGFAVILLLLAGGTVALIWVPSLFGDPTRETAEYRANREKIARMTESQRARVLRRSDRYFNEWTEQQRADARKLHKDLQNAPDSERLNDVLKTFNAWMASLPLVERETVREELRKADNAEQRRLIVAAHKDRQDDQRLLRSLPLPQRMAIKRESNPERKKEMIRRFRESMSFRFGSVLQRTELDAVVKLIAGRLTLSPQETAELKTLEPASRRLRIVVTAMKEHARRRRDAKPGLLSDDDLRDTVESEIEDEDLKKKLLGDPSSFPRRSKYRILFLLSRSFFKERSIVAGNPTNEQLSDFFQKLSPKRQDEIMQESGSNQKRRLKRIYYYRGGKDGEEFQSFLAEWFETMRRFGWRGPHPGGGSRGQRGRRKRGAEPGERRGKGEFRKRRASRG